MRELARIVLREGRERSVLARHPWLLSGSVAQLHGAPEAGDVVAVVAQDGRTLGYGDYDPTAQLRVRLHHFGAEAPDDAGWLDARIRDAVELRSRAALGETDSLRLVNAEGDGLPGLVVDLYAGQLALKATTPAMLRRAPDLAKRVAERVGARGAWLRGDREAPGRALFGDVPSEPLFIRERERSYAVDLRHGQKTGFYLDQRDARDLCQRIASGRRVLDLYAYSGGFSLAALAGGARAVTAVESSASAAALLERNARGAVGVVGDVERFLAQPPGTFDLVISDPPPFARHKRDVPRALRAQRALLRRVLACCAPEAFVLTFSCSHHLGAGLLRSALGRAASESGRSVAILAQLGAPPDHPSAATHPEGEYLSGFWLRVCGP